MITIKVILIQEKNKEEFIPYLPPNILHKSTYLLGCVDGNQPCGFLSLTLSEPQAFDITWLWVEPQHRRRGVATTLLDAVTKQLMQGNTTQLRINYLSDKPYSRILDHMLSRRCFILEMDAIKGFSITREQLLDSPLMGKALSKSALKFDVVPLQRLTPNQLREVMENQKNGDGYFPSQIDLMMADSMLSMVLLIDGAVQGLLLFQHAEQAGVISISAFYLNRSHVLHGFGLLKMGIFAILSPTANLKRLEFLCVGDKVYNIVLRLFNEYYETRTCFTNGTLWHELYQGGK